MLDLVIGIAIGAAFSPFWIKVWNWLFTKAAAEAAATIVEDVTKK